MDAVVKTFFGHPEVAWRRQRIGPAALQGTRPAIQAVTPQRRARKANAFSIFGNRHSDRHAPERTQERHLRSKIR